MEMETTPPPMKHDIMLDLETLGTRESAIVTSIGAVKFNPKTFVPVAHFKENLMVQEQQDAGRTMDARTVQWWMGQSAEAQQRMMDKQSPVDVVLMAFIKFVGSDTGGVWGNGADFDNVILGSLYETYGIKKPWSYSQNRCFRTLKNEFKVEPPKRQGVHHDALDDAAFQMFWLKKIKESLKCAS